jgi:hypothetical protein
MMAVNKDIIEKLLKSKEPSIRYKVHVNILGQDQNSSKIKALQKHIKTSQRIRSLLSHRNKNGKIPERPYAKWYGAHWILADLAELGYPPNDRSLAPLREQIHSWLFSQKHEDKIISINGKVRRCASQEGNALHYLLLLGLDDERTQDLAKRLLSWQWPDGGWNCDKNPKAQNSSFMESLIPLRALALHAKHTKNGKSKKAAREAAEIFLKRGCYKRQKDGSTISEDFVKLHYPCYWHYDILFGLKVLAEADFIKDKRCSSALDLLGSKRLSDGGFPAEKKYYRTTNERVSGRSLVNWGGISKRHMNEFITTDALFVLSKAGRLN